MKESEISYEKIYTGILYDREDVYKIVKEKTGLDVKDDPNYYIGYSGANDNEGLWETFYTPFVLYKVHEKKIVKSPIKIKKRKKWLFDDFKEWIKGLFSKFGSIESFYTGIGISIDEYIEKLRKKIQEKNKSEGTKSSLGDNGIIGKIDDEHIKGDNSIASLEQQIDDLSDNEKDQIRQIVQVAVKELDEQKNVIRVTRRYKNRASIILATAASIVVLLAPLGKNLDIDKIVVPIEGTIPYTQTVETLELDYDFLFKQVEDTLASNLDMGSYIKLPEGLDFYGTSLKTMKHDSIGADKFRKSGDYVITGFSIVKDGNIVAAVENYDNNPMNLKLEDFIKDTCTNKNINIDDVEVMIHFGSMPEYTRAGWVSLDDLVKSFTNTSTENYTNTIEDFSGDTITLNTPRGKVDIPIYDENGNLYQKGDVVIGSDNNEYLINDLTIDVKTETKTEYIDQTTYETKEVNKGYKITYSIDNVTLNEVMAAITLALSSLGIAMAVNRKNMKLSKTPFYDSFDDEEEYRDFLEEFRKKQDDTRKQSKFNKVFNFLFKKQEKLKELTDEQIYKLYEEFIKLNTSNYEYQIHDRLHIENGRFFVTRGLDTIDITEDIYPIIKTIGMENEVVAEGILKGEKGEAFDDLIDKAKNR